MGSLEENTDLEKAEVIALISGKGGVGKTAIAGSMASLISKLGHKVLLIDGDAATHGISYFFIDQVSKSSARKIASSQSTREPISIVVPISENFDFAPTKVEFERGVNMTGDELSQAPGEGDGSSSRIKTLVENSLTSYDFVVIDCQAGVVSSSFQAVKMADRVLSVLEPDPVGVWASRSVDQAFGNVYPTQNTFYLVNKLFAEEVSQYDSLTNYMRIFAHLPPLPFDFEVRRAFARRVLPTDSGEPSAFLYGLVRALRDFLPTLVPSLDLYERELLQKDIVPKEEKLALLDTRIRELSGARAVTARRRRVFAVMAFVAVSQLFMLAMALLLTQNAFSQTVILFLVFTLGMLAFFLLLFVLDLSSSAVLKENSRKTSDISIELELERLREDRKSLVTYLATMTQMPNTDQE